MSRSLAALVYGRTPTRAQALSTMNGGRTTTPPTMYGFPIRRVSSPSQVREDAAMTPVLTRAPRTSAIASTVVTPHWFDDRTFADLVGDAPTEMGALIRSARR